MTTDAIRQAIQQLPAQERAALADWVVEQGYAAWDEQIEADFAPGGPGVPWLERVKAAVRAGQAQPLDLPHKADRHSA